MFTTSLESVQTFLLEYLSLLRLLLILLLNHLLLDPIPNLFDTFRCRQFRSALVGLSDFHIYHCLRFISNVFSFFNDLRFVIGSAVLNRDILGNSILL